MDRHARPLCRVSTPSSNIPRQSGGTAWMAATGTAMTSSIGKKEGIEFFAMFSSGLSQ
jgi:hypothetical protein